MAGPVFSLALCMHSAVHPLPLHDVCYGDAVWESQLAEDGPLKEGHGRGGWEWTTHSSCHGEIYQASSAPRNTWLI